MLCAGESSGKRKHGSDNAFGPGIADRSRNGSAGTGRPDGSRDGTKHAAGTNGSGGTFRTAYSRGTKYTKCPKCAAAKTRRA